MTETLPKLKICGATCADEVYALDEACVDYCGLWHGIPKGINNLEMQALVTLSSIPTKSLKFILVTLCSDAENIKQIIERSGISGIQLHGFQTPALVKKIKNGLSDNVELFKVLHVKDNACIEETMIGRYIDSGVDAFILDTYLDKEKIGSTGSRLCNTFLSGFMQRWGSKMRLMLAGGINKDTISELVNFYNPYGFDIDSSARLDGLIHPTQIKNIVQCVK